MTGLVTRAGKELRRGDFVLHSNGWCGVVRNATLDGYYVLVIPLRTKWGTGPVHAAARNLYHVPVPSWAAPIVMRYQLTGSLPE